MRNFLLYASILFVLKADCMKNNRFLGCCCYNDEVISQKSEVKQEVLPRTNKKKMYSKEEFVAIYEGSAKARALNRTSRTCTSRKCSIAIPEKAKPNIDKEHKFEVISRTNHDESNCLRCKKSAINIPTQTLKTQEMIGIVHVKLDENVEKQDQSGHLSDSLELSSSLVTTPDEFEGSEAEEINFPLKRKPRFELSVTEIFARDEVQSAFAHSDSMIVEQGDEYFEEEDDIEIEQLKKIKDHKQIIIELSDDEWSILWHSRKEKEEYVELESIEKGKEQFSEIINEMMNDEATEIGQYFEYFKQLYVKGCQTYAKLYYNDHAFTKEELGGIIADIKSLFEFFKDNDLELQGKKEARLVKFCRQCERLIAIDEQLFKVLYANEARAKARTRVISSVQDSMELMVTNISECRKLYLEWMEEFHKRARIKNVFTQEDIEYFFNEKGRDHLEFIFQKYQNSLKEFHNQIKQLFI